MAVGFAAGIAGALAFASMLSSVLFQVAPWDPGHADGRGYPARRGND